MKPRSALVLTALLLACGSDRSTQARQPTKNGSQPAAPHDQAPGGGGEVDPSLDQRYAVNYELPAELPCGRESLAKVRVQPRSPWHMNLDFPVRLELERPDGVTLLLSELQRDHAERLDDEELVFPVVFTPATAGTKRFTGSLKFAVCGEEACSPINVPVDFTVKAC